jgi:hypothetical protein
MAMAMRTSFSAVTGGSEVWWWENPYPHFDPKVSWKRHVIKTGGGKVIQPAGDII